MAARRRGPQAVVGTAGHTAETLREWIIGGRLRRGESLVRADLAARLGTSPARAGEAVARLLADGYAHRRGRMTVVAPLRLGAADLLAERLRLEPGLTRLAARRMSMLGLHALDRFLREMQEARLLCDAAAFQRGNYRFHVGLYRLAGRPEKMPGVQAAWAPFPFAMLTTLPGRMAAAIDEHAAVLQALREGDALAAGRAMRAHICQGWQALLLHYPRCVPASRQGRPGTAAR